MKIINCGSRVLLLVCVSSIIFGCASSVSSKKCCSVDWYLSHDASRAEKLSRCSRISAEAIGQACTNAITAEKMSSDKQGGSNFPTGSPEAANL